MKTDLPKYERFLDEVELAYAVLNAPKFVLRSNLNQVMKPKRGKPSYWALPFILRCGLWSLSDPRSISMVKAACRANDLGFFEWFGRKVKSGRILDPIDMKDPALWSKTPLEKYLIYHWVFFQSATSAHCIPGLCAFSDSHIAKIYQTACPDDPLASNPNADPFSAKRIAETRVKLHLPKSKEIRGRIVRTVKQGTVLEYDAGPTRVIRFTAQFRTGSAG